MNFQLEVLFRLCLAVLLGGIIGLEREEVHKPAGLKTNILVCIGATLITLFSFTYFPTAPHIIAAIISGMGFLGAGTILISKNQILGLTTAAGLWLIAGIGIAIGAGFYFAAVTSVILAYLVLVYGYKLEEKIKQNRKNKRTH